VNFLKADDGPDNRYPPTMAKDERVPEPAEKTPKGLEVPIPKRGEFFANLKKVAKVGKRSTPSGSPRKK
jgi:hypothetical protein